MVTARSSVPPTTARTPAGVPELVLTELSRSLGPDVSFDLPSVSEGDWPAVAARMQLLSGPAGPLVKVVVEAGVPSGSDELVREWTNAVLQGAQAIAIETISPVSARLGEVGRWPNDWAVLFSEHEWRFVDLLRPVLWDHPVPAVAAKEGWLVFLARHFRPELVASPARAMLHPDRLGQFDERKPVVAEQWSKELHVALRRVAQRRELEALRHHVDEVIGTVEAQQVQHAAALARLAAVERRVVLLMEQAVGLWRPPMSLNADRSRPRRWRRYLSRGGTVRSVAASEKYSHGHEVTPTALVLFDAAEYSAAHPESQQDPLGHYLRYGEPLGHRPNRWFDPLYYLEQNRDVRSAGVSALVHFADYGAAEGRRPSEEFDIAWYLAAYPEVAASGLNPLLHFMVVGQALGFQPRPPAAVGQGPVARR